MSSKRALNSSSSAASSSFSSSKRSKLDEDVLVGEEVVDGDVDLPSHYDSLTANELYAEALNEMSAVESLASATEREVQTRAVTRLFELALDKFGVSCDLLHLVDKARCQRDFGAFLKVKEYITTALDTFVKLIGKEETDSLRLETLKTRLQLLLLTVGKQVEDLEKEAEEEEEDGDDNEDGEDDIGSDSASVLSKQDAKMLGQLVLELSNVHYNICEAETFSLYFMIRDLFLYLTSSKIKAFKSGRSILSTVLSWFKQLLEDDKKQPRKESAVEEYYATGCFYLGEFLSKGVIEAGDQQLSATQDLLTESKSLLITCSSLFRSILSNANRSMSSAKRATLLELFGRSLVQLGLMEEEDEPSVEYFDEGIQMMKESLQLDPGNLGLQKQLELLE